MLAAMKALLLGILSFLLCFCCSRVLSETLSQGQPGVRAESPPRGWNSYDSFSWIISETEFLQNAKIMSEKLHGFGYEYAVVDYLWYRQKVPRAFTDSRGFDVIDEWGRMIPDPDRWPSSAGGRGFTKVAEKVHNMGLKLGIHVMRGISTQAVDANTPILDTVRGKAYVESGKTWYAQDIALTHKPCAWMSNGFMSVNTKLKAGQAFLRSLYEQYASWGVDFVKHDCVFGDDFDKDEVTFVSEVLKQLQRPIMYSLSPGTGVTPAMAKAVSSLVNMYRVTADDWDLWGDVAAHFDVARDFASSKMIGAKGLLGKSWPDLDMLPLGWLTDPGSNQGPHRQSKLTLDEQKTQMTLWAMAKSPLMFGGDLRKLDDTTYHALTNPTILKINDFSSNNMEFPYINGAKSRNHHLFQRSRSAIKMHSLETHVLGLTSCHDYKAKGWSVAALDQDLELLCWWDDSGRKYQAAVCLYRKKLLLASDEDQTQKQLYKGKLDLLGTDTDSFCLDASPRRKLISKEFMGGSFSPCRQDANQMWELNRNATLSNSYSGLCATVNTVEANVAPTGIRSWIATGREGETYVAFFNLNSEQMVISAHVADLAKVLQNLKFNSCLCTEAWSGKKVEVRRGVLSTAVNAHGCALLVLKCN